MPRLFVILFSLALLLLPACTTQTSIVPETALPETPLPPAATTQPVTPEPTDTPEAEEPAATPTSEPQGPALSFEAATFRDPALGIEFEYPSAWSVVDLGALGDRGSGLQLTANGEPQLNVTILLWDPKNDLDAYVAHRKQAWGASGFTLLSEEELTLPDGQRAGRFTIETPAGDRALFFFTTLGDRYLELSGERDLELLSEITGTVQLLGQEGSPGAASSYDCSTVTEADALVWVACNVIDGLRSRNLSALSTFMADPFTIGYWGSEGRSAPPEEIIAELEQSRLPADPSIPLTFTADRSQFPPLAGTPPENLFGPDLEVALILYSEGWGPDGAGAALLYFVQESSGEYVWHALAYSTEHFDK